MQVIRGEKEEGGHAVFLWIWAHMCGTAHLTLIHTALSDSFEFIGTI